MKKPVFRHWLYREYWDIVARHFEDFWRDLDKVLLLLRIKYGLYDSAVFPCEAQKELLGSTEHRCQTELCPLNWKKVFEYDPVPEEGCFGAVDGSGERIAGIRFFFEHGLDYDAEESVDLITGKVLARAMRDAPLTEKAHELYTVLEEPDVEQAVFYHWLHQEQWDILAKNPDLKKKDAVSILREKYGEQHPEAFENMTGNMFTCTACRSSGVRCFSPFCPLDWNHNLPYFYQGNDAGCIRNHHREPLLGAWENTPKENREERTRLAETIRDLSFTRLAHEIYRIEENQRGFPSLSLDNPCRSSYGVLSKEEA